MPIGVLANCAAVLVGGLLGTALGKVLPPALKEHLPGLFGYCAIAIGVNSIIKASGMTAVVLAILVGFVVGHLLHLEQWTGRFFKKLVGVLHLESDQIDMEFYITAVALFCCSGFGWYSALTEGITGDPSLLLSKAVLDGFTALIFAASLGLSVCAIPLPQCVILLLVFGAGRLRRHPHHGGGVPGLPHQVGAAGGPDARAPSCAAVQRFVEPVDGIME